MAKKKETEYTITFDAQITGIISEKEFETRTPEEALANNIKERLGVDDVVITNYKIFIGQK